MNAEELLQEALERRMDECEAALGHRFTDRKLLSLALTHSSLKDEWTDCNERLEFLGDSVIGLSVSEHLFCTFPRLAEGELTRIKSMVVSRSALADVGKTLDLKRYLRVGKGIRVKRSIPPSLLANAFEALIGAVYLDAGFEPARNLVLGRIEERIAAFVRRRQVRNHKAALQQAAQRIFATIPSYRLVDTTGPEHKKEFVVEARIGERTFQPGHGSTKKQAEQRAAREALKVLKQEHGQDFAAPSVA